MKKHLIELTGNIIIFTCWRNYIKQLFTFIFNCCANISLTVKWIYKVDNIWKTLSFIKEFVRDVYCHPSYSYWCLVWCTRSLPCASDAVRQKNHQAQYLLTFWRRSPWPCRPWTGHCLHWTCALCLLSSSSSCLCLSVSSSSTVTLFISQRDAATMNQNKMNTSQTYMWNGQKKLKMLGSLPWIW